MSEAPERVWATGWINEHTPCEWQSHEQPFPPDGIVIRGAGADYVENLEAEVARLREALKGRDETIMDLLRQREADDE